MLKQNIHKQHICEHLFSELSETVESSNDNIPDLKPAENTGILESLPDIKGPKRKLPCRIEGWRKKKNLLKFKTSSLSPKKVNELKPKRTKRKLSDIDIHCSEAVITTIKKTSMQDEAIKNIIRGYHKTRLDNLLAGN